MPEIDGLTLVKTFRANEPTRETPMIVLSTKEEPTVKAEAFALGANDYIVKLPDRLELLARIRYHSKGYINLLQRNEAYARLQESQRRLANEMNQAAHVRPVAPAREAQEGRRSGPTGGSSPRPSWGATRSATTGSTTTTSPSSCWTSAATGSARPCSRSRRMNALRSQALPQTDFRQPGAGARGAQQRLPDGPAERPVLHHLVRRLSQADAGGSTTPAAAIRPVLLMNGPSADQATLETLESHGPMIGAVPDLDVPGRQHRARRVRQAVPLQRRRLRDREDRQDHVAVRRVRRRS